MNTAAILARISRDESGESFSIPAQVQACHEYAKRNDLDIPEENVITEEYTGTTLERPGMQQLQKLIRSGEINHVITMKVNRIARKSHLADYFLQEIIFPHGVTLHIVEWGRPVEENKNDIMWFGMQSQFSQFERNDIIERTKRGKHQKAAEGIWLGQGHAPYGYNCVGSRRNTDLEIVPEEAEVVRYIFNAYTTGTTASQIARDLNEREVLSPSERIRSQRAYVKEWTLKTIGQIIRRETYTGNVVILQTTNKTVNGKRIQRYRKEKVTTYRPDLIIVDKDVWEHAKRIRDSKRDKWTFQPKYEYLVRQRIRCLCGLAMATQTSSLRPQHGGYRCVKRRPCSMTRVKVKKVDALVWDSVERYIRNINNCLVDLLTDVQRQQQEQNGIQVTHEMIATRQKEYNTTLLRLYRDLQAGRITDYIYMEEKKALDHKLKTLKDMYEEQQSRGHYILTDEDINTVLIECHTIADGLDALGEIGFQEKRAIIERLDVRVQLAMEDNELVLHIYIMGMQIMRTQKTGFLMDGLCVRVVYIQ